MLKIKTKKFVEVSDWDNLVEETYKVPYSFQQQDDCKDRGIHKLTVPCKNPFDYENTTVPEIINGEEMGVSFFAWQSRDPKEWYGDKDKLDYTSLWWYRNFYPSVDMVANDLYNRGLLKAGEYVINIDW
jgi:hypothetical protein